MIKTKKIKVKSILTPSKLPGADLSINPYLGCSFGCQYCYAAFIGRFRHPGEEWGSFVDVKINAPEILKVELEKFSKKFKTKDFGAIFFSSVTDPYLGLEGKYKITRKCLEILVDFGYKGEVSILTKSPLVTRDIDLFKKLESSVGLTVTTLDDKVVRFLEGKAPLASKRIEALEKLNKSGVKTYAFVGPLLPHFTAQKQKLEDLFTKLELAGVREIFLEHINLQSNIKERLFKFLEKNQKNLINEFEKADSKEYRKSLNKILKKALKGKKLKLQLGKVIYHHDL